MSYTKLDGCIALAMLEQALNDHNIKEILTTIAHQLHQDVLSELINQEKLGLTPKLSSLAMQHCSGDKFVGALLPQYEYEFLDKDPNGRQLLLTTIDSCLKESKINTSHEFLSLMKSIDGMAFIYDMFETNKKNINHLQCKTYISPTSDEISIRDLRQEKLAITYGIETKTDIDLIEKKKLANGCVSGKARFFILPTENRDQIWFEKLANQSTLNKASLPLIAGPSNATAKNFIMIHGLALFKNENGLFDLDNAQKFANCFMAYLVYCGHHSFLEVVEIWNRLLDFLVIEKPEQLAIDIISTPSTGQYMDEPLAIERKLSYAKIGDYASFLHPSYAEAVLERAQYHLNNKTDFSFDISQTIFKNSF